MKKQLLSLVAVFSLAGAAVADQTPDRKVLVLKSKDGAAILGYDAVAYFTDNKPVKGIPKFIAFSLVIRLFINSIFSLIAPTGRELT